MNSPAAQAFWVAGADGCLHGWVGVRARVERGPRIAHAPAVDAAAFRSFDEFMRWADGCVAIAVDIPIGLMDHARRGGRDADRAARAMLRQRAASVFAAPVRGTLDARDYPHALAISRGSSPDGIGLSMQSFNLLPKIREVDRALRASVDARNRVCECHPELSFAAMGAIAAEIDAGPGAITDPAGVPTPAALCPCRHRKATPAGRAERLQRLAGAGLLGAADALPRLTGPGVKPDDILDAYASAWTAARGALGVAIRFPMPPPIDATGLEMAITV